jgi:hypothetical protein
MSAPAHVVIETWSRTTPFGVGFMDVASGELVSEGLAVRVFTLAAGGRAVDPVAAIPNRRGLFVAHGLFGPAAFDGEDQGAASPPDGFLVEVRDDFGRYTPFVMHVGLPASHGLVAPACLTELAVATAASASPPPAPVHVPILGTASRRVPAGLAVVRASLVDRDRRKGAEFAVLEVRQSGRLLARGIADARGEVAAVFAYPEPTAWPAWSPPGPPPSPQPLARQTWSLDVSVRYRRDLPRYTPDTARPSLADLCEVLQQPLATVSTASPPVMLGGADLTYGEELVLGARAGGRAELLIDPA